MIVFKTAARSARLGSTTRASSPSKYMIALVGVASALALVAPTSAEAQSASCDLGGTGGGNPGGIDALLCGDPLRVVGDVDYLTLVGQAYFNVGVANTALGSNTVTQSGPLTDREWEVGSGPFRDQYRPPVTSGATAIGSFAYATGDASVAIGDQAGVGVLRIVRPGTVTFDPVANGTAVGGSANVTADGGTALGANSRVAGLNSTALGSGASDGGFANSVALGAGTVNTAANQVHIGDRTLSGIAAGTGSTDAVNVAQLTTVSTAVTAVSTALTAETSARIAADAGLASQMAAMNANLGGIQTDIGELFDLTGRNRHNIGEANEGVAMALALDSPTMPAGSSFALSGGVGHFKGRTSLAMAISAAVGQTSSVSAGIGYGTRSGDVGARAGFQIAW